MRITRFIAIMAMVLSSLFPAWAHNNAEQNKHNKAIETIGADAATNAQSGYSVLKGKVTDSSGAPLIGVAVYVNETTIGVSTDANGYYELSIPAGENFVVKYSFLGMETYTYVFTGKNTVHNVALRDSEKLLSDVVVIGYGAKDKRSVTSSVSSINKEQLEKLTTANATLDNMLGGAMKGVRMNQSSGEPGAVANINVRGITSPFPNLQSGQSSNVPLYVIDGIATFIEPNRLNPLLSIAPNDIASIDVLKDAAATAIYGSRGANGVIIVTTKNGKKGERMSVDAGYTFSVGNPVKEFKPLSTLEFKEHQDLLIRNTVNAMNMIDENYMPKSWASDYELNILGDVSMDFDPETFDPFYVYKGLREDAFGTANTNWSKEIRNKNAQTHQYNVSLRGGSERTDYSVSFNAMNQEGLEINDQFNHYGIRSSINSEITKRIKVGTNINYSYSDRKSASEMEGFQDSFSPPWLVRPDFPVYDKNGMLQRLDGRTLNYGMDNMMANPVALRQKRSVFNSNQFSGNGYIDIQLMSNLVFHSDINLATNLSKNEYFSPLVSKDNNVFIPFVATLSLSNSESMTSSVNFRLDYKLLKDIHSFTAMAGYGSDRNTRKGQFYSFEGFPNDKNLSNMGAAKMMTSFSDYSTKSGLNSLYSRLTYSYDSRYLAEVSFRADESSKFGPNNRWGLFPAVSLGWRVKQENFLIDKSAVDDLKLRLSWGKTGSTNVPDFSYLQYFERIYNDLYGEKMAIKLRDLLPNENVRWEMTTEYNGGLDFAFFKRRLYGSLDLYYRYTDGALAPAPHILESGISAFYSNIIDMSNRGFEFEIGGDLIRRKDFKWNMEFNISQNRNRIEKLNSASINPAMQDAFIEGKPAGTVKGYKVSGIIRNEDERTRYNTIATEKGFLYYQEAFTGIGDYVFQDTDNDGHISSSDRIIIANPEPDFFGGLSNSFRYKQMGLSFLMQFSKGAQALWSPLFLDMGAMIGLSAHREVFRNSWTPENPNARYPMLVNGNMVTMNSVVNDRMVFDASYLRMKNITFTYDLPKKVYGGLGLSNISLFAATTNLFTLTKWPGLDPELVGTGTTLMGRNEDPYPLSRTFSIGAKFSF